MKFWEKRLLLLLCTGAIFVVGFALSINWYSGMGDNATYSDITLNIARTGRSRSQVLSTIIDYIFTEKIVAATPLQVQGKEFPALKSTLNTLSFHFTPIQYLIAPLARAFPINIVWGNLIAISYVGMLVIGYYLLRKRGVSLIATAVMTGLFSLHPSWNDSLFGQIYIDRIFLLTAMAMLAGLTSTKTRVWLVSLFTILSCLIIEKMAIIVGVFLILYSILYGNKHTRAQNMLTTSLGVLSGFLGFLIIQFVLNNNYYSSFLSLSSFLNYGIYLTTYPNAAQNLVTFILTNLPLLLLAVFEWRALLIALVMMIPNIVGNLGGAEKIGFVTHYHTTYFPFLIWAAIQGFVRIYRNTWTRSHSWVIPIAISVFAIVSLYPFLATRTLRETWPLRTLWIIQDYQNPLGKYTTQMKMKETLEATIPAGAVVSTPERYMIYLFQRNKVYYYPLGMDGADYVVVDLNTDRDIPKYRGIYSYLGSEESNQIDEILLSRMIEKGYDIDHPTTFQNMAIIERLKRE